MSKKTKEERKKTEIKTGKKKLTVKEWAIAAALLFISAVTLILCSIFWYLKHGSINDLQLRDGHKTYKYHYMLIESDPQSNFWKTFYKGAKKEGEEQDIYVENLAESLGKPYTIEELMEIAAAADVDGIIAEADGSDRLRELIDKASEQNITVVTVHGDSPKSKRRCFVGMNGYQLGEMYGSQIIKLAEPNEPLKADVLMDSKNMGSSPDMVYAGMRKAVSKAQIQLNVIPIDREDIFSAEEMLRSIVLGKKDNPDVLVCLNEVDTICAYQAVVDYNAVGRIKIIGYYSAPEILNAIRQNVIFSSVTVDAENMGKKAVHAVYEASRSRYTNEFEAVTPKVICKDNVEEYGEVK